MIEQKDPEIAALLAEETARQSEGLTLIPSENHSSKDVLEALSSVFTDKYAEGYPNRRYYAGNAVSDKLEQLVIDRAKALFDVPYANVQPYSGSPANFAVYLTLLEPGAPFMGLDLLHGGHLTHGWKMSATSKIWKSVPYDLTEDGQFDFEKIRRTALDARPKFIWCGGTAIPRAIPWKQFAEVADAVGAYLVADMAHIAGLVAAGVHESPAPYAHVITTTTHKTLRGPRGAMILVTEKGLKKDPELGDRFDKTIIPGAQGGPHLNTIAALGVALNEAALPTFKEYGKQIVQNTQALVDALLQSKFKLVSNGSDNHLILIDLSPDGPGRGVLFHEALERIGIYANKNTVPGEQSSPFYPSGLRIGTPAVTSRGMTERDMQQIASWITQVREHVKVFDVPSEKTDRKEALRRFRASLSSDNFYDSLRQEVRQLAMRYPIPALAK